MARAEKMGYDRVTTGTFFWMSMYTALICVRATVEP